jgi:uncharacterized membrane protein
MASLMSRFHLRARVADRFGPAKLDLSQPRRRGVRVGVHYDPEAFGRFSEAIARFLGTARFLVMQTLMVIVWMLVNVIYGVAHFSDIHKGLFDPFPFILLNLAFSTQAAYAAPLILLAQNRQGDRERQATESDRATASRTQADTEFLARELASIRLALSDVITVDELDRAMERAIERALERQAAAGSDEDD